MPGQAAQGALAVARAAVAGGRGRGAWISVPQRVVALAALAAGRERLEVDRAELGLALAVEHRDDDLRDGRRVVDDGVDRRPVVVHGHELAGEKGSHGCDS